MAAAEQEGGRVPDLYERLEVDRGASGGEITQGAVPAAGPRTAEDDTVRLAVLAELTVRYLADEWGWPW